MRYLWVISVVFIVLAACSTPFVLENDPCKETASADSCYFDLTTVNHTFACPLITDERLQSICAIEAVKFDPDPTYCDYALTKDRASCVAERGISLRDQAICQQIVGLEKDYCITRIADETNTPLTCDTVESVTWREQCFSIFGVRNEQSTYCRRITDAVSLRDSCIVNVSLATQNASLCLEIKNTDAGDMFNPKHTPLECVLAIAREVRDYTPCHALDVNIERSETCIYKYVLDTKNVSLCKEISLLRLRRQCLARLNATNS